MKLPPLQNSQSSIKMGLQFVGKANVSAREWSGKFAQQQYRHQYPAEKPKKSKFAQAFTNSIIKLNLTRRTCGLCQLQKDISQIQKLCACHHQFCFSCLNSYAITKIQDLNPVKCPQIQCNQTMILTSNVYRYLPDTVKLKYLSHKNTFKIDKQKWENSCQRCLQPKHTGQCKISISNQLIENSFKHRQCPKCKVEIRLTSGKKKVTCTKCKTSICYICGVLWANGHKCDDKNRIRQLQNQYGYRRCSDCCCDCCNYGCQDHCVGCGDCCCRECGSCCDTNSICDVCFYCGGECSGCCVFWNIFSIPIRMILTCFALVLGALGCCFLSMITMAWVFFCLIGGGPVIICQIICQCQNKLISLLALIFFPISILIGGAIAVAQTYKTPGEIFSEFFSFISSMFQCVWVNYSPRNCDCM